MTRSGYERIWIAHAPSGVPSSGPAVITAADDAAEYAAMGWEVSGPYVAESND